MASIKTAVFSTSDRRHVWPEVYTHYRIYALPPPWPSGHLRFHDAWYAGGRVSPLTAAGQSMGRYANICIVHMIVLYTSKEQSVLLQ